MDKQLIFAVAGSGKTYHLVQQLNLRDRFLLATYTEAGTENLRREVIQRFDYIPENIKIKNFFSFLYSFCYKPFLSDEKADKGIYWGYPNNHFVKGYTTSGGYLYHNRISRLVLESCIDESKKRLAKYYDYVLIDEVQDFAGYDFDFLLALSKSPVNFRMVGDFYQHTFDTSRDGNKNKNLHNDYPSYIKRFLLNGFSNDSTTLVKSRRCSQSTCDFIRNRLGIAIESATKRITECRLIDTQEAADLIFMDENIVKLFYQQSYNYQGWTDNWANCKGLSYPNVCVVLNQETEKAFQTADELIIKAALTRNKFYVACSRSEGDLYFLPARFAKKFKKL